MKPFALIIAFLSLIALTSCDFSLYTSGYDFHTTATYVAPKSHLKAFVNTTGYVPKGQDLGDPRVATINTTIAHDTKPFNQIEITSSGEKLLLVNVNGISSLILDSTNYAQTISNSSKQLRLVNIDETELQEFAEVILSTSSGPKGTYLKGQTKNVIVDTVYYTTSNR